MKYDKSVFYWWTYLSVFWIAGDLFWDDDDSFVAAAESSDMKTTSSSSSDEISTGISSTGPNWLQVWNFLRAQVVVIFYKKRNWGLPYQPQFKAMSNKLVIAGWCCVARLTGPD